MADLALLLLTLFWGTTFSLVKEVLGAASTGVFLVARFGLAALVLGGVWLVRRERPGARFWRDAILLGVFMLAGFGLQTIGLRYTTPSRSGFITGLAVVIVPFVARFLLGQRVRAAAWVGVAVAVVGLVVLTRPFGAHVTDAIRLGDLFTLGCALAFALQIVFTARWAGRHALVGFVFVQVTVTLLGALVLAGLEERFLDPAQTTHFYAVVAFTGVAMTAVAFFVMNWGQARTTAVRAALIFALEPVFAAVFSHFYWGEPFGPWDLAGGGLIVLAVVLGEVRGMFEARAEESREVERAAGQA
jgi:drug/metabolite transporter (DMT)-like permease